jgi:putative copper resistance protein D
MGSTVHIIMIWLHILGIALFVGPQFFIAFAWVPASRQIADLPTRVAAMRTITRRFGYIGGAGMVLIVFAGSFLVADWRSYYNVPDDTGFMSLRFGVVFTVKMALLVAMLAVVGLHMFWLGPRQLAKLEAQSRGEAVSEAELRKARMQSMALSITGLLLTLVIMVLGAMLNTANWSLQAR